MNFFRILAVLAVMALGAFASASAGAQEPLKKKERKELVKAITEPWNDWETLTISGKLKMAGLPLSPSVKIYMEKDSVVRISLRAPLMGEVGRAEIEGDTLTVVNKMKKTYVREPLDSVMERYPVTLSDVQSLLIGRVVIPGGGTLTSGQAEMVELFAEDDGQYSLIPSEKMELTEFNYGYLIDSEMQPSVLMVIPAEKPETSVNVTYDYDDNGYDMIVSYLSPEKNYSGTLRLDYPSEGGSPIEPIRIDKKYTRLDFGKFMKAF